LYDKIVKDAQPNWLSKEKIMMFEDFKQDA